MKYLALVLLFLTGTCLAEACTEENLKQIGILGVDNPSGSVYTTIKRDDGLSLSCGCGYVRFYPERADTDKALSILMAAKISDRKIRLDFQEKGNCDSAYRAYVY